MQSNFCIFLGKICLTHWQNRFAVCLYLLPNPSQSLFLFENHRFSPCKIKINMILFSFSHTATFTNKHMKKSKKIVDISKKM